VSQSSALARSRAGVVGRHDLDGQVGRAGEVLRAALDRIGALAGDEGDVGSEHRVGVGAQEEAHLTGDDTEVAIAHVVTEQLPDGDLHDPVIPPRRLHLDHDAIDQLVLLAGDAQSEQLRRGHVTPRRSLDTHGAPR